MVGRPDIRAGHPGDITQGRVETIGAVARNSGPDRPQWLQAIQTC
jgi:hypothetical protein